MSGIALLLLAGSASAALSVTATPYALNSGALGSAPFTTSSVTAIPAGGAPPYTYAWSVTAFPVNGSLSINSPTAATTTVDIDGYSDGDVVTGTITCVVTDSLAATASVDVAIRHRSLGSIL